MIRRPPRSTQSRSSAASDVYKRQIPNGTSQSRGNYFYTDAGPSTADGGAFGNSGSRKMSVSFWFKTRKDDDNLNFTNAECVVGGNRGSSGEGSPMFTNYNSTVIQARMHTSDPGGGGLGRAADVQVTSLSLDTWYHVLFTSEETGGNVVQNLYVHNEDGTIFNTATNTATGKTWYISSSYPAWWIWGKDNRSTSNSYYMGHGMALSDVRIFSNILTSGNSDVLATEPPTTSIYYADLGTSGSSMINHWKLGPIVAPYTTVSYTDDIGGDTLTPTGNAYGNLTYFQPMSGFVTLTGSAGITFKPPNRTFPTRVKLQNMYVSGSDTLTTGIISDGSGNPVAYTSQLLQTKGTVVLE